MLVNRSGSGRKRATTVREDTKLVREVKKNPSISASELKEMYGLKVCTRTIQKRLRESGLINCYKRRKAFISSINKKKRLEFAKVNANKDLAYWNSIMGSDESKFELFGSKKRDRVW